MPFAAIDVFGHCMKYRPDCTKSPWPHILTQCSIFLFVNQLQQPIFAITKQNSKQH